MTLPRLSAHQGAYPSMRDTVFPGRGHQQPDWGIHSDAHAQSAPAGSDIRCLSSAGGKKKSKSPFDWGRVAEQYQVPDYVKMKGIRPKMAERAKSRRKSRENIVTGAQGEDDDEGVKGEAEVGVLNDYDFYWPRELNEKMIDAMHGDSWRFDSHPDVHIYNVDTRRRRRLDDAIHQVDLSEHYIQQLRARQSEAHERSAANHRQRAREIEASVKRYFRPPSRLRHPIAAASEQEASGETVGREGHDSRAGSAVFSEGGGWKTQAQRRYNKQHPEASVPNLLPSFSQMANMGLASTRKK